MVTKTDRKFERVRRHKRVRNKISGTAECPRLCVYRSNTGVYVQVIDDVAGVTLAQASTLDKASCIPTIVSRIAIILSSILILAYATA